MLVDTHCHLDFVENKDEWIENAIKEDVRTLVCVGTEVEASKKCVDIAEKYSNEAMSIFASVGLHPQEGQADINRLGLEKSIDELRKIARSSAKVIAVGECGLDYWEVTSGKGPFNSAQGKQVTSEEEKKEQRELFKAQVGLAAELDLPLIVHCRNGWSEIFNQLETGNLKQETRGLFHSWTGDWEAAMKALDMGFYISFSGILTFKNAPLVQEVAKKMPLGRILLETDAPFLSPEPQRGEKNEPKNVRICATFLAKLRNLAPAKIEEITSANTRKLFKFA